MSFKGDPKRCFILRSPKGRVFRPRADPIHRIPSHWRRGARREPGPDWRMGQDGRKADKDAFAFLELNDGSCLRNLQVIMDAAMADLSSLVRGRQWRTEAASCWDQAEGGAPR
ncbi:hypothetical protein FH972_015859 [Carpinus fangiana]|uniref:Uncharacterized protein n=1 Tax=Carpinus fangiana TaxID=176857 RepID=A0A5N6RF92_9ROSI|nr:hypothetical protein FH972_015859 [Carpinus fangiana]